MPSGSAISDLQSECGAEETVAVAYVDSKILFPISRSNHTNRGYVFDRRVTNRRVNPGLLRPGHLDQLVDIPSDDVLCVSLRKAALKKTPLAPEVDLNFLGNVLMASLVLI